MIIYCIGMLTKCAILDVDECSSSLYKCINGTCENLPGSWSCDCPQGYRNHSIPQNDDTEIVQCESKCIYCLDRAEIEYLSLGLS